MRLCILLLILANAMGILAHSDEDHSDDDAETVDVSSISVPDHVNYHQHVRPIIEAKCVACHSEGQIAAYAPFDSPEIVKFAAEDVRFHVTSGLMPPWMPSRDNVPLKHDRSLSDEAIALIAAWVEQGAALGDPADFVPGATDVIELPEIRADLTLMLDAPYTPAADVLDDYRCFPFALNIAEPQFITGYDFIPDVAEMAHHGLVYLLDAELSAEIGALDGADGRAGWPCYGGTGLPNSGDMIATWTPGTFGVVYPPGTGFRVEPGQTVVLQMHYNLWTTRQPDQTRLALQLEPADAQLLELETLPLTAPVEIPCPTGVDGPQCERENAIQRIAQLYGEAQSARPDRRLRNCRQTLEDYADNTGENATTFCDYPSPFFQPLTVYGVLGHMHELGRSFRLELNPGRDDALLLLDIPRWDFHWQDRYEFVEPLQIKFGEVVRMSCTWDNSLSDEPRYVVWGEGTSDEMCFAAVLVAQP